jgi:hypothetical protein
MVSLTCNTSIQEAEAGGSGVYNQSGLHGETLHQNFFLNKAVRVAGVIEH